MGRKGKNSKKVGEDGTARRPDSPQRPEEKAGEEGLGGLGLKKARVGTSQGWGGGHFITKLI